MKVQSEAFSVWWWREAPCQQMHKIDLAASILGRGLSKGTQQTPSRQAVWKSQLAAEAKRPRGRLGTQWRGGGVSCYLGVSSSFPSGLCPMLYALWMRPTDKGRWPPGFPALHSTELGSNPRAVSLLC